MIGKDRALYLILSYFKDGEYLTYSEVNQDLGQQIRFLFFEGGKNLREFIEALNYECYLKGRSSERSKGCFEYTLTLKGEQKLNELTILAYAEREFEFNVEKGIEIFKLQEQVFRLKQLLNGEYSPIVLQDLWYLQAKVEVIVSDVYSDKLKELEGKLRIASVSQDAMAEVKAIVDGCIDEIKGL